MKLPGYDSTMMAFSIAGLCVLPLSAVWLVRASEDGAGGPAERPAPALPKQDAERNSPLKKRQRVDAFPRRVQRSSATVASSPRRPEEASLVEQLRQLQLSDPAKSLELARLGHERFPSGSTAAERTWFEARALVELGRFDEAREVARAMLEDFPNTSFTADVRRHLLSHPFGLPPREH